MNFYMATSCLLLLAAVTGAKLAPAQARLESGHPPLATGEVHQLRIDLDASALAGLRLHPRVYVKGTLVEVEALKRGSVDPPSSDSGAARATGVEEKVVTNVFNDVGIHLKGNYGTFQGFGKKPSLTLNFDKFVPGQKFHGPAFAAELQRDKLDKLHLNNSVQDGSFLSEVVCRELFQAAGVPVARASHAKVELNGRDAGLYVLVEGYNKTFLKRHFKDTSGHLYDSEFEHDVTDHLKCSAGGGPPDHSDLQALVKVSEEVMRGGEGKLASVLDLDRFYSFLALEIMTCHFDGYARGINNYWAYHDPGSGRMVFLPHGMDQMFLDPEGSLFPELRGIVAEAVLATAEGRKEFRLHCSVLFTNSFPGLSNRVEELRARIRPELAQIGGDAVLVHDRAVAALQNRIRQRVAHLQKHLFAPEPNVAILQPGETMAVTNWLWSVERGRARMGEEDRGLKAEGSTQNTEGGDRTKVLLTRLEPTDKDAIATWEARVLLPKGSYRFSGSVACEQAFFRGPESLVSLKIWGGVDPQFESNRIDSRNLELMESFVITSEPPEEILIQCQAQSKEATVSFEFGALKLTRLE